MKILRLTLRNLASLAGTHTVDFEREPLRSTGLFSISGATGSGKSTLLDALCVALYERTPRLVAANGTKLPDVGDEVITQSDPANLLRRGEAEGFAEVAFVGVDGAAYTARWSIRRARQKRDGALQKTEMVLYRGNVGDGASGAVECGGKKTEVLAAIAGKVGLSFAQFTRAVLLAQNDFAVFLKADDKERAEILQALTGTERFEHISKAVFERERQEREQVQALRQKAEGQLPLDTNARVAAEAALRTAQEAVATARRTLAERTAQLGWFQRDKELNGHADAAERTLMEARTANEAAAPRRRTLERAEAVSRAARSVFDAERHAIEQHTIAVKAHGATLTDAARAQQALTEVRQQHAEASARANAAQQALTGAAAPLQRARALDAQLLPLTARATEKQRERDHAEATHRDLLGRQAKAALEIAELEQRRLALTATRQAVAHVAPVLDEASAWLERLKGCCQGITQVGQLRNELTTRRTAETEAEAQLKAAATRLEAAVAAHTSAVAGRGTVEKVLRGFDADALATERRTLDDARAALVEATEALRLSAAAGQQLSRLRQDRTRHLDELTKQTATLAQLTATQLPAATTAVHTLKEALVVAEAAVANAATVLREALRPGQPCPVCGSEAHPYAAHAPVVNAALLALRAQSQQQQAQLERLRDEKARLETGIASLTAQARTQDEELQRLDPEFKQADQRVVAALDRARLDGVAAPDRVAAVDEALAANDAARTALAKRESAYRAAVKARDAAGNAAETAQAALAAAEKRHGTATAAQAAAVAARTAAEQALARGSATHAAALAALAPLFAALPDGARGTFAADAATFITGFDEAVRTLRTLDQELTTVAQRVAQLGVQQTELASALAAAEQALQQRRSEAKQAAEACAQLRQERRTVFEGRAADDVERELNAAVSTHRLACDSAAGALVSAEKVAAAAAAAVQAAEQATASAAQARDAASAAVNQCLATYPQLDRAELAAILARPDAWFRDEHAALASLAQNVDAAHGAVRARRESVQQHGQRRPTPEDEPAVTAALAAAQAAEAAAEAHRVGAAAVVSADDARRTQHAELLRQIEAQERKAAPWAKLNDLIGSADGAKFRTIVQGRTLDLLLSYANAQLELLAARYRLERLRPALNLIVVDRDMADERRSVYSLSGGESFLVSLALALGLASLTSNRLRIESLFIDEGFGSLDPATLNTAMNALMHLEAQGRKVGVISHVTEMADAIPVQIRVVKGQAGASRLIVPGTGQKTGKDEIGKAENGEPVTPPGAKLRRSATRLVSPAGGEATSTNPAAAR